MRHHFRSERARRVRGFTLIELLIVVAIIGILAAIAVPNLLNALQRARQKRSMADIRTIATAWESFAIDSQGYAIAGAHISWPDPTDQITDIEARLTPTYVKKIPVYDGWNNVFRIGFFEDGTSYSVSSYGADSVKSISLTESDGAITTNNFDCDIIFSEGIFVVYPEGVQSQ